MTDPRDIEQFRYVDEHLTTVFRFETKNGDMVRLPVVSTSNGPMVRSTEIEYDGDPKVVMEDTGVDIPILQYKDETDN